MSEHVDTINSVLDAMHIADAVYKAVYEPELEAE